MLQVQNFGQKMVTENQETVMENVFANSVGTLGFENNTFFFTFILTLIPW